MINLFLKCILVLGSGAICNDSEASMNEPFHKTPACPDDQSPVMYYESPVPLQYHYLAPDGSEIRLLTEMQNGGLAHCTLPIGSVSEAIKHQTIEEIWHFLEGRGLLRRKQGNTETITPLYKGMTIVIPPEVAFQFRNIGETPLVFIITTMPPWPGEAEAIKVDNYWPQ